MAQLHEDTKNIIEELKNHFVVDAATGVATIDPSHISKAMTDAGGDIDTLNKNLEALSKVMAYAGGGFGLQVNQVAVQNPAMTTCTAVIPMGDSKNHINLDWTRQRVYPGIDSRPDVVKHGVLRIGFDVPAFGRRGQIDAVTVHVAEDAASLFKS